MKQLLSFGHLHVLSSDNVELIIDKERQIFPEQIEELAESLKALVNIPYGLMINLVNGGRLNKQSIQYLAQSPDIGCVSIVEYVISSQKSDNQIGDHIQVFDGFRLGRSQAMVWLDQYLTRRINSDGSPLDAEAD